MNHKLVITKWAYLKTPIYTWAFYHANGEGVFTNSGGFPSRKRCLEHARFNARVSELDKVEIIDEIVTE